MPSPSFTLPQHGDTAASFEDAARQLSAIPLTMEQIWRGYRVHADSRPEHKMPALIAWAEGEGLRPADVAAYAVVIRSYGVMDALSDGIDLRKNCPEVFKQLMVGPIYAADLGWFEPLDISAAA